MTHVKYCKQKIFFKKNQLIEAAQKIVTMCQP